MVALMEQLHREGWGRKAGQERRAMVELLPVGVEIREALKGGPGGHGMRAVRRRFLSRLNFPPTRVGVVKAAAEAVKAVKAAASLAAAAAAAAEATSVWWR